MRYAALAFICLCAVIAYVQRSAMNVPLKRIQESLQIDDINIGIVVGAWYLGYALFQLPAGWLADRLGSKRALVLFCVMWSALTGAIGLADGFLGLLVLWFLMGVAQAGVFPTAGKAIGGWFTERSLAIASGLLVVAQLGGAALAPALTAKLLPHLSWQLIFGLYAIPGFAWAILFTLMVRQPPREAPARHSFDWRKLIGSGTMRLLFAQQFLRGAAMVFYLSFFPKFLQETAHLTETEAGTLAAWPSVGAMLGGLLGGIASDGLLRLTGRPRLARQGIAVLGMLGCTLFALASMLASDVYIFVAIFSIGVFWGAFGGICGYAVTIEFGGTRVGTVFATMNMGGNIGGSLFPLLVGYIISTTHNWNIVIYLFAALFAADAILWALLNPKRPLFEDRP